MEQYATQFTDMQTKAVKLRLKSGWLMQSIQDNIKELEVNFGSKGHRDEIDDAIALYAHVHRQPNPYV